MVADSFKITDRRSAYIDEKDLDKPLSGPSPAPKAQLKPTQTTENLESSKRQAQFRPKSTSFDADTLDTLDNDLEGDEFDKLPEDHPAGQPEPPPMRGLGRGTPFSMRPIELTQSLLGLLVQKAYVSLGLMPNPETGRMKRDLEDARESIELLEVLITHFSGKWQIPGMEAELQNRLSDLRLQYARLKG